MNHFRKLLALVLCLCLLGGVALAETAAAPEETTEAVPVAGVTELAADTALATVGGETITWGDAQKYYDSLATQYGQYYDLTDAANLELFRAVAMANAVTEKLVMQYAKANALDQFTEEERAALNTDADATWQSALDNYVSANGALTEDSTEEQKTAAYAEAEKYFADGGYSLEKLRQNFVDNAIYDRVQAMITKDVAVSDEDVETSYQAKVAADQETYANDPAGYESYNQYVDYMNAYAAYSGTAANYEHAWYKPDGFRAVKHILLKVDEALMTKYTDLQARLEEQLNAEGEAAEEAEATADPSATADPNATAIPEPTATPVPVTQADVDAAKAEILASLADKIDEINQKLADGASFDDLIVEYGVDAEGNATDPGMNTEPTKTSGYEVAPNSSKYASEFVDAAFSVDNIGDVSAPFLSSFGVHIVKYIADVEGGPIVMTDAERESLRSTLLTAKQNEAMNAWEAAADVQYTGAVKPMSELEQAQ